MKNLLTVVMLFVFSTALYAQKDVTKFLGIPVDGTKTAMIQKLKAKGFTPSTWDKNILESEFNGFDVNVHIVTNNNKVWRIMLADKITQDETGIKIRFNELCRQFENNKKYKSMTDKEQTIPDDEDLSYEMTVNNKRYDAGFYQISPLDTIAIYNESKQSLLDKYTQEQLDNPTEEISTAIQLNYLNNKLDIELQNIFAMTNNFVWFMITEHAGKYYITMFYDNEYNHADGEDL